jgi:hypothetical protein
VSKLRILRGAVLSAGIMAALLVSVALASSAYAQIAGYGYAEEELDHYYGAGSPAASGWGPNWRGWAPEADGNNVPGVSTPYRLGAPQTLGPR